jgi:spore maturation protein SpmA
VLNWIWLALLLGSIVYASIFAPANMGKLNEAFVTSARDAVQLVIGLVGLMVFFLGLTRVAFDGGLRDWIARRLQPLTRRLFPEVPADHPAMGAMIMNMASNVMGLGNAATPFGLKAMAELARINPHPGSASNAMVLFLAINATSITLMPPFGTIAVRAAAGSVDPWSIWLPTVIATTCSTSAAVAAYYLLGRLPVFAPRPLALTRPPQPSAAAANLDDVEIPPIGSQRPPMGGLQWAILGLSGAGLAFGLGREVITLAGEAGLAAACKAVISSWMLPLVVAGLLLVGVTGRVRAYDSMIEGAKEGLHVAVRIVPYLVAILVAVAVLRASGALDLFVHWLDPLTSRVGVPAEALPMALLRPLSGSGSFAVMSEILTTHGADSFIGNLSSTLMGSTETTFYVVALYLGAAGVVDGRHTLAACLIGDVAGFIGAVAACHWFFGA